eukprot:scaffold26975_cov21-Tisochrysis_lutea.AAC.2
MQCYLQQIKNRAEYSCLQSQRIEFKGRARPITYFCLRRSVESSTMNCPRLLWPDTSRAWPVSTIVVSRSVTSGCMAPC